MREKRLYKVLRPIIKFIINFIYRPKVVGKDNIPKEGKLVLAGNHTKNLDSLLLISTTKRCIHFLAKDSLSKGIKKILFNNMGIIPVNRKIHDKEALNASKKILNNDGVIGIFPEGTINRTDDVILPFKIGAVKMAFDTKSPIVAFTITGKYRPFKNNLTIKFEKPYKISNIDLDEENKILMGKIKNELNWRKK